VVPIFIFYLIWTYGIRRMAERQGFGGLMSIGKSRAKVYVETDTKVTFHPRQFPAIRSAGLQTKSVA
jgi:cell division protease FtsH